jgi:hypothetical protein
VSHKFPLQNAVHFLRNQGFYVFPLSLNDELKDGSQWMIRKGIYGTEERLSNAGLIKKAVEKGMYVRKGESA